MTRSTVAPASREFPYPSFHTLLMPLVATPLRARGVRWLKLRPSHAHSSMRPPAALDLALDVAERHAAC